MTEPKHRPKAIGYIRVSTIEQAQEGISLDAQRMKIQTYCDLCDLDLIDVVEDAGISWKCMKERKLKPKP